MQTRKLYLSHLLSLVFFFCYCRGDCSPTQVHFSLAQSPLMRSESSLWQCLLFGREHLQLWDYKTDCIDLSCIKVCGCFCRKDGHTGHGDRLNRQEEDLPRQRFLSESFHSGTSVVHIRERTKNVLWWKIYSGSEFHRGLWAKCSWSLRICPSDYWYIY